MSVESGPPPETTTVARAAKILTTYYSSSVEQRASGALLEEVLRNSTRWRVVYACAENLIFVPPSLKWTASPSNLLFPPTDSYRERLTQTMVLLGLYSYTQLAMLQRLASLQ